MAPPFFITDQLSAPDLLRMFTLGRKEDLPKRPDRDKCVLERLSVLFLQLVTAVVKMSVLGAILVRV